MKARPLKFINGGYDSCAASEATHVELHMPGPFPSRLLPVILRGSRDDSPRPVWSWNGDTEKPTLKPSILTRGTEMVTDEEVERIGAGETIDKPQIVCHTWINDGQAQFLGDSTHEFAGQTLDMLEVEE